jgi:probable phosphoglycerate mutase
MSLCLLVRHAAHDAVDRILVGRSADHGLSAAGRGQAAAVARAVESLSVTRLQSSPQRRAVETVAAIAASLNLPVEICPELDEVDFGAWAGRSFAELDRDVDWSAWNAHRGRARPSGGESMRQIQARVVAHLQETSLRYPAERIAMVSHAEIIRAAALHAAALPLDAWAQFEVPTGSITAIACSPDGHMVVGRSIRAAA